MAEEGPQPASKKLEILRGFELERILDQDPRTRTASLLGTLPSPNPERAILLLEKTHFSDAFYSSLSSQNARNACDELKKPPSKAPRLEEVQPAISKEQHPFSRLATLGKNDIYTWLLGWFSDDETRGADVKMTLIRPATEAHIAKYSSQAKYMVYETPKMYRELVQPWILSQPEDRIRWVYNILERKKESENIIYEDTDPATGFIILPDLKWDRHTLSSLYLIAIVQDRSLRSLRDLRPSGDKDDAHIQLLKKIRDAATKVAKDTYGLEGGPGGALRCFVHYQPTYYHLHVHILSASFVAHPGASVGQAHLLEDLIDLLENHRIDMSTRTLGYSLGERSALWNVLNPGEAGGAV